MGGEAITLTLPSVAFVVANVCVVVGMFYNLKGKIGQQDIIIDNISVRLEDGKAKMAALEESKGNSMERITKLEVKVDALCERMDKLIDLWESGKQ